MLKSLSRWKVKKSVSCLIMALLIRCSAHPRIKQQLKLKTGRVGTVLSMYYATLGTETAVSSVLGTFTALGYVKGLSDHVDNIESSPFQKHLLIPVGCSVFEAMWNASHEWQFDYGVTLICFLSYQVALFWILMDEIFTHRQ